MISPQLSPVGAHGGNCGVESAAVLANHLDQYLKSKDGNLTSEDVHSIFKEYQDYRKPRVQMIYNSVHSMTRLGTLDTYMKTFLARCVVPWKDDAAAVSALIKNAPKVEFIPVPKGSKGFADSELGCTIPNPMFAWVEKGHRFVANVGFPGLVYAWILSFTSVKWLHSWNDQIARVRGLVKQGT